MSGPNGAHDGVPDRLRYRFGDVVVDTQARTLTRAGAMQTLEPKAYAVLLALLRRPHELVTRDELLDEVWGHRHVTPGVLTRAIAQLRHALADDPHEPRYIRTRHALGYCFIGDLLPEPDAEVAAIPVLQGAMVGDGDAVPTQADDRPDPAGNPDAAMRDGIAAVPDAAGDAQTATAAPHSTRPPPHSIAATGARPWRPVWLLLGCALVLGALALAWSVWRGPVAADDPSIAVLPFTSLGGSSDDRYFAEGLAVEMHDALARVPGLQVVAVRGSPGRDPGDARTVGRRLRVANVLEASVRRDGQRMRVNARLSDTRTGTTRWAGHFDRENADVFGVQAEVASEVVQALLGVLPDRALAQRLAPTRSVAAYDAYLKGLQHLQASDGDDGLQRAVAYFQDALGADPAFARAQAGVCRAEIVRFEHGLDAEAFGRAEAACRRAAAMAPDLREVDLALGEMYRARGDHDRAVPRYTRALDDIALRPAAYVGLARVQGALGRKALAREYFDRALRLSPNDASIHRELGYQAYLDGDVAAAVASFRTATALAPDDEGLWSSLGGLYLATGDETRATDAFERSLAVRPNYAALSNYGSLRYEARDYRRAAELYRHAAELDPGDFRIWGNLGDALAAVPANARQARASYRRAAALAERYTGIRNDDAQAFALLGWYRANLGDRTGAREALARAEALGSEPGEVAFLGAQTFALLDDDRGARERLVQARAGGISRSRLDASPQLGPLLARTPAATR